MQGDRIKWHSHDFNPGMTTKPHYFMLLKKVEIMSYLLKTIKNTYGKLP